VEQFYPVGHFVGQRPRDDDQVTLPGCSPKDSTEAVSVGSRTSGLH
jgi:hypothetical protein